MSVLYNKQMINFIHGNWDIAPVLFLNNYCGKSLFLDTLQLIFLSVDAIRTAILVALIMGIWEYGRVQNDIKANKKVIAILFSIILSLGIIETLNAVIQSPRPIVTYESQMRAPLLTNDTKPLWKNSWVRNEKHGSFPSDTVALLGTLAFGIFFWNRSLGIIAILYVIISGIIPRLYFGLHYPSDMFLGLLIAFISTITIDRINLFNKLSEKIIKTINSSPYLYGAIGFYTAYIISEKFILIRKLPIWIKSMLSN